MAVPLLDLSKQHEALMASMREAFEDVVRDGRFVMGPQLFGFEQELAEACGVRFAVGLSSGTDALLARALLMEQLLDLGPITPIDPKVKH